MEAGNISELFNRLTFSIRFQVAERTLVLVQSLSRILGARFLKWKTIFPAWAAFINRSGHIKTSTPVPRARESGTLDPRRTPSDARSLDGPHGRNDGTEPTTYSLTVSWIDHWCLDGIRLSRSPPLRSGILVSSRVRSFRGEREPDENGSRVLRYPLEEHSRALTLESLNLSLTMSSDFDRPTNALVTRSISQRN